MRKVDWSMAPSWANWYTEDEEGAVFWLTEPKWDAVLGVFLERIAGAEYSIVSDSSSFLLKYIEQRPTVGDPQ